MSELQCVARLKIPDGKLEEFKRLVLEQHVLAQDVLRSFIELA
ncbi:MAG TPA: hypothetical protein VGD61_03950 [Pyrinomonadaceae bacterium]